MKINSFEELIPEKDAAKIINVSKTFLSANRDKMKIPYYKIGGRYKYRLSEISIWLKQRKAG